MSRPLHILIDARWIFREISGIGLYTQELISALCRISTPHNFTLLFNDREVMARTAARTGFTSASHMKTRLVGHGPFSPKDQLVLGPKISAWKIDVFHAPNYMMPLRLPAGVARVVTIHDLIPLLFRSYAPRSKKNRLFPVFKYLMHRVAAHADRIIAVSESTRRDVTKHLLNEKNSGRVVVIPEAADPRYKTGPDRPPRDHVEFLFVGRRDPYKNLPLLLRCLADVRKLGIPARLRVIGPDDPRYPEARQLARDLQLGDAITWSGYVSDDGLLQAYQSADVFVFPSNYEGFGLPVLEAMACGTPVICSDKSSLPEVAGDAALLINPDQPQTLTDAMIRVAGHPSLRADLARRGLARAAHFSWAETARKTLSVYEAAAEPA